VKPKIPIVVHDNVQSTTAVFGTNFAERELFELAPQRIIRLFENLLWGFTKANLPAEHSIPSGVDVRTVRSRRDSRTRNTWMETLSQAPVELAPSTASGPRSWLSGRE
jgi:hypothetical protein